MNSNQLKQYITEHYNSDEEYPWATFPNYCVFRHKNNKKWFALIMDIPKSKIGLSGNEKIDVLDLKCDPIMIGSLLNEKGFFPAYHMSKANWITVALDGSADDEKIKWLIDISYELTSAKKKDNCMLFTNRLRGGAVNYQPLLLLFLLLFTVH